MPSITMGAVASHQLDLGNPSALNNMAQGGGTFTTIQWVRVTTFTSGRVLISKARPANNSGWHLVISGTGGELEGYHDRATTDMVFITNSTPLVVNEWRCIAMTINGGSPDIDIFVGAPGGVMAECTYGTTTTGSGALNSESTRDFRVCNRHDSSSAQSMPGQMGPFAVFGRALTLTEMTQWMYRPQPLTGCKVLQFPGFYGISMHPDFTGNQLSGAISGSPALYDGYPPIASPFGYRIGSPRVPGVGGAFKAYWVPRQTQAIGLGVR